MINRSQRGAWGEAHGVAWLIANGYEVYEGKGNPSVDFIALLRESGELLRVEVKAASRCPNGRLVVSGVKPENFDLLLVVTPESDVLANPSPYEVYGISPVDRRGSNGRRFVNEQRILAAASGL